MFWILHTSISAKGLPGRSEFSPSTLWGYWEYCEHPALQLKAAQLEPGPATYKLPDEWRRAAEQALGQPAPTSLREDPGPTWDTWQREEGDRVGLVNVARAEALLGE